MLRALVASAEFRGSAGRKVRDPGEDVVATYRALGLKVGPPTQGDAAVNAMLWQVANLGTTPLAWPRPDGAPLTGDAWSSPSRVLASFEAHWVLAGGWWPKVGVTYRRPPAWVPALPDRVSACWSTTSAAPCCSDRPPRPCWRPAAWPPASRPVSGSPATTTSCGGTCTGSSPRCSTPPPT